MKNSNQSLLPDDLVIACNHVLDGKRKIKVVFHDEDGDWQFMCGADDHLGSQDGKVVCFMHLLENDPTLEGVRFMHSGFCAERDDVSNAWLQKELNDS